MDDLVLTLISLALRLAIQWMMFGSMVGILKSMLDILASGAPIILTSPRDIPPSYLQEQLRKRLKEIVLWPETLVELFNRYNGAPPSGWRL